MEKITLKKSFAAKLILAGEATVSVYQVLKDLCSTHKNVKTRLSFNHETINFGRQKVGVMKIGRKNISLYLALNPEEYEGTKYNFEDVSDKKNYEAYPMMLKLKSNRSVKYACELLEQALVKVGASTSCEAELVDYSKLYYPRTIEELIAEGFIKKMVGKKAVQPTVAPVINYSVYFTAKLLYEAQNNAEELYIITSYDNWDLSKAIKMQKNADNTFVAKAIYPKGTKLEFKICKSESWADVEKGIWKEEIVNHNYVIVDGDVNAEDLIYNFRS